MREVKFRYLYKDFSTGKTFTRVFTLGQIENGAPYDEISDCPLMRSYKILNPVVQFTGRQDKNGADVFESDLIKNEFGRTGAVVWNKYIAGYDVEFVSDEPKYELATDRAHGMDACLWSRCVTVIGNIQSDAPELQNNGS